MRTFGLIGRNLSHSFSATFFKNKFKKEGINDAQYELFPLNDIAEIKNLIANNDTLCGLNVTIPYKESIVNYLDALDKEAEIVGAVNTIKITGEGSNKRMIGYNTDVFGFEQMLKTLNLKPHKKALVLGTGGAAKAVACAITKSNIETTFVSRKPKTQNAITYNQLTTSVFDDYTILVNATPVGMYPHIEQFPDIPYELLGSRHLVFDLIYNPQMTVFLSKATKQNAYICNGLTMLYAQAEKSWLIWNDTH